MFYTFTSDSNGFDTNNFFYDNGEEVVVFDSQFTPALAQQAIAYIQTKTKNPITYIIITHPNPDKFNAMSVYQQLGAKVIASRQTVGAMSEVHEYKKYYFVNVAKMFTEETYPTLGTVDTIFDQTFDLTLKNGEIISLQELHHSGVSSNQTIAYIPKRSALIVGDLVHYKIHAWLEGGIVNGKPMPMLNNWINALEEVKTIFSNDPAIMVYGGRGEPVNLPTAIITQINYLKKADDIVKQYIQNLGENKTELQGNMAQTHYANLQHEFEKTWPDYKLSYMIGYSIYGLVNSKL